MSEHNNEYDDFYYDDGRFGDNGYHNKRDSYDIPTYDELELEGRYYLYGSREEYSLWRNEQIQALHNQSNMQQANRLTNNTNTKPNIGCTIAFFIAVFILILYFTL